MKPKVTRGEDRETVLGKQSRALQRFRAMKRVWSKFSTAETKRCREWGRGRSLDAVEAKPWKSPVCLIKKFKLFWEQWETATAAAAAKSLQSCLTLCDSIDGSPPGSPIPGILQARTLEWVVISFSNAGKWKVKGKLLSHVRLFVTPWTAAHKAPPSMGFSRQECWSGVPSPSPFWEQWETIKHF